jgi:hypothetical protein
MTGVVRLWGTAFVVLLSVTAALLYLLRRYALYLQLSFHIANMNNADTT